jgi:tetratricopeptide (TPR) repeat protein
MSDPKENRYDPEAATFVAGSEAPARPPAHVNQTVQTPVPDSSEAATMLEGAPPPLPPITNLAAVSPRKPTTAPNSLLLQPGTVLGSRYQILEILGEGGMGAVYKARDIELDRIIALKVIRPELASNPEILQRFKQELILARQVTDRNVIRIFDLGEADGIRFITMEYVEGESLYQILRRQGKVEVQEAVGIMKQMLRGLHAAHREGVIHRDLKPGNIMRDAQGRIVVMDFGLARSFAGDGMTRTGTMLGTMEYMSPEQAQAKELDARSDLFTAGLICYELLTGHMPYRADSAVASLLKRMQERAVPAADFDKSIPQPISQVLSRCLERDPANRYQNVGEILRDLEIWESGGAAATLSFPDVRTWGQGIWAWVGVAVVVVAMAGVAWYSRRKPAATGAATHTPVSVLVADFQNNTSDTLFDGTLEPMVNVALEGAAFINAYNRGNARQAAGKLPNPSSKLDEQAARLVAVSEGINAIVTGSLSLRSGGYRLSVEVIDAVTGKTLATSDITASNKDDLLLDIPKLAAPVRKALGDTTPESVQIAATQGSFAASNLEVVHQFGIAKEQQSAGKMQEAFQSFSNAAKLDPNFARAYAGMAAVAGNLGQLQNAEKYAKLAMEHVDRMTERERYFVRGMYYIRTENWQKCVEEYSDLLKQYSVDNIGHNNLALCYGRLLNMPRAMEEARRGLEITPKDVMARMNFALYACYAGDFQTCGNEASHVLQVNPSYEEAFLVQAYAELAQGQVSQAAETYNKLQSISPWGASLAFSGLADIALYQGKYRDAVETLEKGAAADIAAKKPDAAADKFVMLAYGQLLREDKRSAAAAAQRALARSQSVKIQFLAARALVEAGEIPKARKLADTLGSSLQTPSQAYSKLILGEVELKMHNPKQAVQLFSEARDRMDTWISRLDLGRAYLDAAAFVQADSEFDRCIKRRGEALELFMDDGPSYSYVPALYYYEGRVREGLKSPDFGDFYRTYLTARGNSAEDPLVAEIHRRLGK